MDNNSNLPQADSNLSDRPGRSRRGLWIAGAVAGVLTLSTLGACGHHRGGWHGGSDDPSAKIEHMVDRVFSRVEATDDQKARITSIAQGAYKDLAPLRGQFRSARTQALELLTAEQIDAAAVESLRADQIQLMDQASNRATSAMTEIAQVLTPEQRAQVREKLAARMEKRRGWGRWRDGS